MHELAERAPAGSAKAVEPAPVSLASVSWHDGQPTHAFSGEGQHLFKKYYRQREKTSEGFDLNKKQVMIAR